MELLTVNDAARLTGKSRRTILRWFEREPGVLLVLDSPEECHKRRYRTFRIPRAVFERVIAAKGVPVLC